MVGFHGVRLKLWNSNKATKSKHFQKVINRNKNQPKVPKFEDVVIYLNNI